MIRAARVGPTRTGHSHKDCSATAVAPSRAGTGTLPSRGHAGTPRQPGAHDRARGGPPSVAVTRGLQPANAIGRSVVAQAPSVPRLKFVEDIGPGSRGFPRRSWGPGSRGKFWSDIPELH